jgi:phospholipase/carboxylesterase
LGAARDGLVYIPTGYRRDVAAPLAVMLHGAGGSAARLRFLFDAADEHGIVVLAPDSRERRTWDAIVGSFGPDIEFLERALDHTFDRCAIAPGRLAIGGFSDGASYALSAGLASGDLFTHICAFSPGFVAPATRTGRPDVFISHGTRDTVLAIDQTSRRIVPQLRSGGYRVTYEEFDGGHTVPPEMIREAFERLARG